MRIRNATKDDLDAILRVEQSWPEEGRAGADKFIARLERFPQGFFLACIEEEGRERVIGTLTSMPLAYEPAEVARFDNWATVTNNGYLFEGRGLAGCNAVYVVSGVIETAYRHLNVFEPGVLAVAGAAQALGMRYVVAGAVIPGYRAYCQKYGATDPYSYCTTRRGSRLIDPLLLMYERIGFTVRDASHVVAGYYPDDASMNYAALVVRDLRERPL
jgi:hypothetical protein